eukprot:2623956-Prymnesium_polylepis.2
MQAPEVEDVPPTPKVAEHGCLICKLLAAVRDADMENSCVWLRGHAVKLLAKLGIQTAGALRGNSAGIRFHALRQGQRLADRAEACGQCGRTILKRDRRLGWPQERGWCPEAWCRTSNSMKRDVDRRGGRLSAIGWDVGAAEVRHMLMARAATALVPTRALLSTLPKQGQRVSSARGELVTECWVAARGVRFGRGMGRECPGCLHRGQPTLGRLCRERTSMVVRWSLSRGGGQ